MTVASWPSASPKTQISALRIVASVRAGRRPRGAVAKIAIRANVMALAIAIWVPWWAAPEAPRRRMSLTQARSPFSLLAIKSCRAGRGPVGRTKCLECEGGPQGHPDQSGAPGPGGAAFGDRPAGRTFGCGPQQHGEHGIQHRGARQPGSGEHRAGECAAEPFGQPPQPQRLDGKRDQSRTDGPPRQQT